MGVAMGRLLAVEYIFVYFVSVLGNRIGLNISVTNMQK